MLGDRDSADMSGRAGALPARQARLNLRQSRCEADASRRRGVGCGLRSWTRPRVSHLLRAGRPRAKRRERPEHSIAEEHPPYAG